MLRCSDGALYTGIATDVGRRLAEHEHGSRGSKYLRGRGPFRLVFEAEIGDRALATRAELRIKRLDKRAKERLVCNPAHLHTLLGVLNDQQRAAPGAARGGRGGGAGS
jgi:putative endonuclease